MISLSPLLLSVIHHFLFVNLIKKYWRCILETANENSAPVSSLNKWTSSSDLQEKWLEAEGFPVKLSPNNTFYSHKFSRFCVTFLKKHSGVTGIHESRTEHDSKSEETLVVPIVILK